MTLLSLQKTLALLVMPAGLLWLLLFAGCLRCFIRRQRVPALLFLSAAVLEAIAGNVYLGSILTRRLEAPIPPLQMTTVQPFDAVCVLGGGSQVDPFGQPQANHAGDRIVLAARLWHAGKARVLVASGATHDAVSGDRNLGEETRLLWRGLGIPDSAILVVEEPCWITRDELVAYRRLQGRFGWHRVALVSSAWHLPRAMALARREGFEPTPVGADWQGRPRPFQLQFLVPQAEGFAEVHRACWEYLGHWVGH
ncbi:YdcF family protein [Geothrix oryzisoli]|uniref:YdcF family protein n=1 Tax=Geothrix oryzisoli TaxID=2922721 RepID=UPI001FABD43F|nr:YdcF family protein [Geothrix oryzisoli]